MSNDLSTAPQDEGAHRTRLRALALSLADIEHVEEIARGHGLRDTEVLDLLATDEGYAAATAELERLRETGELLKHRAIRALDRGVERLHQALDDEALPPATTAKIANELFKMTGLAGERASRLQAEQGHDRPVLHFGIYARPEDVPATPPGDLALNIIMPSTETAAEAQARAIDGEVIPDAD